MISVESRSLDPAPSLKDWVKDNSHEIVGGIEKAYQRRAMESVVAYDEVDTFFNRSLRSLSEMPICDHAWSEVSIPPGCRLVPWDRGKVCIYHPETDTVLTCDHHAYVRDAKNRVMCVTPGLFEAVFEDLRPGERLRRLKEKAPDLVTLLSDKTGYPGIAVLYGTDRQIYFQLGFIYSEKTAFKAWP